MLKNYSHLILSKTFHWAVSMEINASLPLANQLLKCIDTMRLRIKKYLGYFLVFSLSLFSSVAYPLDLELTRGINATLPIAIDSFHGTAAAQEFSDLIKKDFEFSGQFKLIPSPSSYNGQIPSIAVLRQAGADSFLSGQLSPLGSGRYKVSFELHDTVAGGRILLQHDFQVNGDGLRGLAHHISDMVYEKLTGERGIFSTHIAYIVVQREHGRSRHSLEIADADGFNPQTLLQSSEPIMSPSWSPDGREIAYVSFEKKKAQIFTVSIETGKRRLVTDFAGINGAPAWSPDGRNMVLVLSKGGAPKIYSVDLSNGQMKQLTFGDAIDTEPRYSPDGSAVLFTSGRGGSPQVYRLNLADGSIHRLTYEGNYNAKASYTPSEEYLVMQHRMDKNFTIAAQDNKGQLSQLTFSSYDESPSIAPNGRLIVYATRYQDKGVLSIVSLDGHTRRRLPFRPGDAQEPAWSPL